ncbi:uncharacterized protein LOC124260067 [Haliotis rubra]|uniref:uncharacterized protein LOC124260067 n=1 Tax=Haliotis rubra TaxID=36100 RepID=UPI001EE56ABF|nr:uncharacterized protein LOC124260067 [Haliotis rubra]
MADKPVDPVPEKAWQKDLRLKRHNFYKGSQYPPFSIEPLPYDRQRLSGDGMSESDRALRRQWVKDQELSPREPRIIEEIKPKNVFKRMYNAPWNAVFGALKPIMGEFPATLARLVVPRTLIFYSIILVSYYQLKYHPNDWTRVTGFHIYTNKPAVFGDQPPPPEKNSPSDFCERGFKSRNVLLDGKTSRVP